MDGTACGLCWFNLFNVIGFVQHMFQFLAQRFSFRSIIRYRKSLLDSLGNDAALLVIFGASQGPL